MTYVNPVPEAEAVDKAAQAYSRIKEVFELDAVPEVFQYMGNVPPFVHDFFMNFRKFVMTAGKLDEKSKLLIAIAVAGKEGSQTWLNSLTEHAEAKGVSKTEITETLAIGATNSMYNVLFKFRDISGVEAFDAMPVGLRAHTFQSTSLPDETVELINLTLSDINACKPCTAAHVAKARKVGVEDEAIYEAVQCAATMIAGTQFLRSIGVA